jgi:hypothetical protein
MGLLAAPARPWTLVAQPHDPLPKALATRASPKGIAARPAGVGELGA